MEKNDVFLGWQFGIVSLHHRGVSVIVCYETRQIQMCFCSELWLILPAQHHSAVFW